MAVINLNNSHTQIDCEKLKPREQMLEKAFDFHTMCTDSSRNSLYCVHSVISGLALEIILKSFNSVETEVQSEHITKYAYNRSNKPRENHDLVSLLDNVPLTIKTHLFNERDIEIIKAYRDVFFNGRYLYEKTARDRFDNSFIKLVGRTIFKMICLYKNQGSVDPFITYIDDETLESYRQELYRL
ncbi:hypothetical protein [Vibrio hippocampi]|uniref:HEPN domain-containing protein n=1 Tax=Vibrio hippocampi TaxID=654686 RepID=A0ABN8DJT4_9VIBR|nr:hypothetical protein [Vibrio hippocampi]CAH0525527.1 hypothetical protein VHP8226_01053 [Vibrio hippocampi]